MTAITRIVPAAVSDGTVESVGARERAQRKWLISYQAIEPLFILLDAAAILAASLLAELLAAAEGDTIDFFRAAGLTLLVSSLFVGALKIYDCYRPTKLLA